MSTSLCSLNFFDSTSVLYIAVLYKKVLRVIEDKFSRLFQSGSFILNDFCKQKMDFLTLDKTFVLDNLNFVEDNIFFVQADLLPPQRGLKANARQILSSQTCNKFG